MAHRVCFLEGAAGSVNHNAEFGFAIELARSIRVARNNSARFDDGRCWLRENNWRFWSKLAVFRAAVETGFLELGCMLVIVLADAEHIPACLVDRRENLYLVE